jgi:DNA-binding FadR family transcriptional regulator
VHILDALAARDRDAARAAMEQHIATSAHFRELALGSTGLLQRRDEQ